MKRVLTILFTLLILCSVLSYAENDNLYENNSYGASVVLKSNGDLFVSVNESDYTDGDKWSNYMSLSMIENVKRIYIGSGVKADNSPLSAFSLSQLEYIYFGDSYEISEADCIIFSSGKDMEIEIDSNSSTLKFVEDSLYSKDGTKLYWYGGSSNSDVSFLDSVTDIMPFAFQKGPTVMDLSDTNVVNIHKMAFDYYELSSVCFPSSLKSIGDHSFVSFVGEAVYIPSSVNSIGRIPFGYTTDFYYGGTESEWINCFSEEDYEWACDYWFTDCHVYYNCQSSKQLKLSIELNESSYLEKSNIEANVYVSGNVDGIDIGAFSIDFPMDFLQIKNVTFDSNISSLGQCQYCTTSVGFVMNGITPLSVGTTKIKLATMVIEWKTLKYTIYYGGSEYINSDKAEFFNIDGSQQYGMASCNSDKFHVYKEYTLTFPENDSKGAITIRDDQNYTFVPEVNNGIVFGDITYKKGTYSYTISPNEDGSYTIPKVQISSNGAIVYNNFAEATITFKENGDYLVCPKDENPNSTKYKKLLVLETNKLQSGTYKFNNSALLYSDKYNAYVAFVDSSITKSEFLNNLAFSNDETQCVDYSGDIYFDNSVSARDALPINAAMYGIETSYQITDSMRLSMDLNGDMTVDVEDIVWILQVAVGLNPNQGTN